MVKGNKSIQLNVKKAMKWPKNKLSTIVMYI